MSIIVLWTGPNSNFDAKFNFWIKILFKASAAALCFPNQTCKGKVYNNYARNSYTPYHYKYQQKTTVKASPIAGLGQGIS